jgi:hypothetical protein
VFQKAQRDLQAQSLAAIAIVRDTHILIPWLFWGRDIVGGIGRKDNGAKFGKDA